MSSIERIKACLEGKEPPSNEHCAFIIEGLKQLKQEHTQVTAELEQLKQAGIQKATRLSNISAIYDQYVTDFEKWDNCIPIDPEAGK